MSSGLSRRAARGKMKKENIVTRKWGARRKGKTDWARVDKLTDEDIAKAVANDPDAAPIDIDWSDAVLVIPARKKAISIRVDEDVLDYFKSQARATSAASTLCCVPTCSRRPSQRSALDVARLYRSMNRPEAMRGRWVTGQL